MRERQLPILLAAIPAAFCLIVAARADDKSDLHAAWNQAFRLEGSSDYAGAAKLYERALALASKVYGERHESTADLQDSLASQYAELSRFDEAEALYQRSLKTREAVFGADHLKVASSLNNLAILYDNAGQFARAEPLYMQSLKIRQARLGPEHPEVAMALGNLAVLFKNKGQYSQAESYYVRALKIRETKQGADHPETTGATVALASLYVRLGRYSQAEPLLLRSLKLSEAKFGPDHPALAVCTNNLAIMYKLIRQDAKAEAYFLRTLKLKEAELGPNHPSVALSVNNLAVLYNDTGRHAQAEPLFQRCLKIQEATVGPEHPEVALALNNLANLYDSLKRPAEAEALYERSLRIREAALGPDHPDVSESLNNLARLYLTQGRLLKAEPLFVRSLKILEAALGPEHPETASHGLNNLANLEIARRQPTAAAELYDRARRIVRRHVAHTLPMLSEEEQLTFLRETDRKQFEDALSLAASRRNDRQLVAQAATWLANSKAVAQDSLAERAQLTRDAHDPTSAATATKLLDVRTELASLTMTAPSMGQEVARRARLQELWSQEQALAKEVAASRGHTAREDDWVTVDALRDALPAGTVLIDVTRLDLQQFLQCKAEGDGVEIEGKSLGAAYLAWIVPRKSTGEVTLVNLGSAAPIDAAVEACQAALKDAQTGRPIVEFGEAAAEQTLRQALAKVSQLVLEPLLPHLRDAERLILSPDAGLWLIPWAALPVDDKRYAVERWTIRYVTSGREVVLEKLRANTIKPGAARILADPDFDASQAESLAAYQALLYPGTKAPAATVSAPEGAFAVRSGTALGSVARLPGTAVEAASIAPKLKEFTQLDPKVYLDRQAQEGLLKLIKNPRVLLLSTHGFFLPDQQGNAGVASAIENPLLRCGLLFSGCNNRDKYTDPRLGDGILTGLEIVGCDLRGTELVVLSACETGLGQVHSGEGVAGLRQAFQLAGARSVVSTLWQIPDRQSAALMNDFFANLTGGESTAEALRNAQLAMVKSRREKHGAAHPLFWAAWTVTGS